MLNCSSSASWHRRDGKCLLLCRGCLVRTDQVEQAPLSLPPILSAMCMGSWALSSVFGKSESDVKIHFAAITDLLHVRGGISPLGHPVSQSARAVDI